MSQSFTGIYPTCDKCGQIITDICHYIGLKKFHPSCGNVSQFTDAQLTEIKKLIDDDVVDFYAEQNIPIFSIKLDVL